MSRNFIFLNLWLPYSFFLLGFYCDKSFGVSNVSVLQSCPKGYYCPKGTRYATQFPCSAGSYNPKEGMDSPVSCLLCPAGHFCPFLGLAEPAGKTVQADTYVTLIMS